MKTVKPYHHYKGKNLSPSEMVEREVVRTLLTSKVPDNKRETSVVFELKHQSECAATARILAQKRGLDVDLAEAASVLHDIYTVVTGSYDNHGPNGAKIARKILKKLGGFNSKEVNLICEAVAHHSEKNIYSDKPLLELVKDADVFSCSYYKGSIDEYKRIKSAEMFAHYHARIKKVRRELGLPKEPVFRS